MTIPRKKTRTATNEHNPPIQDIACVDLFCGAGGLTHGLIDAGVRVVAGVDSDEACKHPYEANHNGSHFYNVDVERLEASKVKEWFGEAKVRVLAGCAPCQPFSNYSLRYQKSEDGNNVKDDGRWLPLKHFGRLVEELTPDIITMENVPSVMKHSVFNHFNNTLIRLGYEVWVDIVDCANYGLPQRRHRTVLLASRLGKIELVRPHIAKPRTVADALKGLRQLRHGGTDTDDPLHTASRLSELNYERIKVSKPGGSWRDWPPHLIAKCHSKKTGKSYPGVYGRMKWDEPAPTLTTQFYGFGSGRFGHPSQARGLSLREGAILQGFPQDYSFVPAGEPIRVKIIGRLIGNAVPVDLGRAIGSSIVEHVEQHGPQPLSPPNQRKGGTVASTRVKASTPETRRRMQRVRQKNTSAESALRRELHARGLRYRIHVPVLTKPRRIADVALSSLRVAVFVDGCFWHGCPLHGTWPKENADFWRAKIIANQERDRDTDERLRAAGWRIVRVWAHEPPEQAARRVAKIIEKCKARSQG